MLITLKIRLLYNYFDASSEAPAKVFYKKGVLKNSTKFTGKHLCQSLFFNKEPEAYNFIIKKETLT